MFSFENDYSEGACPLALKALVNTNNEQLVGYGMDKYSLKAQQLIKEAVKNDNVDVHFLPGGTPCNVTTISMLRSYEAVICVETGHINVHETGGPEATGHKLITCKGVNGKITPEEIEAIVLAHQDEHVVKPKLVFISNSTEIGTIYTKKELTDISNMCHKHGLYLYLDGARLGAALVARGNDLTLKDICDLTDIFYIGGTKNGALIGEALVISNDELKPNFRNLIKQHNAMLAKGRLISTQFIALFHNDTYFANARNAVLMAQSLVKCFERQGIQMSCDSPTNQVFPIIENSLLAKIQEKYRVSVWGKYDDNHTIVRFCCSWATKLEDIKQFYRDLVLFQRG